MRKLVWTGLSFLTVVALLAACGQSPVRYASAPVPSGERISIGVSRLEVRDVSLPAYARSEEIWRETEGGALESDASVLWADEPERDRASQLDQDNRAWRNVAFSQRERTLVAKGHERENEGKRGAAAEA